jgi:hypothetical protein
MHKDQLPIHTHRYPLPVKEDLGKLCRAHPAPELGLVVPGQAQVSHVSLDELGAQDMLLDETFRP